MSTALWPVQDLHTENKEMYQAVSLHFILQIFKLECPFEFSQLSHECMQKKGVKLSQTSVPNQHTLTSKAHELGLGLPLKLDATVKMVTGATAELTEEQ